MKMIERLDIDNAVIDQITGQHMDLRDMETMYEGGIGVVHQDLEQTIEEPFKPESEFEAEIAEKHYQDYDGI